MKAIEQLKAKAAKVGVSVDDGAGYCINLDAPAGYRWNANGCTVISEPSANNSRTWYVKACKEMERMATMGLELITDAKEIEVIEWEMQAVA